MMRVRNVNGIDKYWHISIHSLEGVHARINMRGKNIEGKHEYKPNNLRWVCMYYFHHENVRINKNISLKRKQK